MTTKRRFAEGTDVPVERSRAELDAILSRAGATQRAVYVDDVKRTAAVQFTMAGRMVRLEIRFEAPKSAPALRGGQSSQEWIRRQTEQKEREAWRRMVLVVKAKLELVADGGSTVEREFLGACSMTTPASGARVDFKRNEWCKARSSAVEMVGP